jgi:hypothetical protein
MQQVLGRVMAWDMEQVSSQHGCLDCTCRDCHA